jgi:threonine dehydratase
VLLRDLARAGPDGAAAHPAQDRPGALFSVVRLFEEHQINIIEVYHQRIFTTLPAKGLFTDFDCEARDAAHLKRLIDALEANGFDVHPVEVH